MAEGFLRFMIRRRGRARESHRRNGSGRNGRNVRRRIAPIGSTGRQPPDLAAIAATVHNFVMTKPHLPLDTMIEIIAPENIAFRHQVAGPFRRLQAYLIDLAVRWVVAIAATIALAMVSATLGLEAIGLGAAMVFWFALAWFYGGFFEAYFGGQTPGKRLVGIRVVTADGRPITAVQAFLRNILRTVDAVGFYLVGLVVAATNDRFQRLGDLVCGTMVVVEQREWLPESLGAADRQIAELAMLIPPMFEPSPALGRALAAYVGRRRHFPLGRRAEIAWHVGEPLRRRFGLPRGTSLDLLLCAVYYKTFIADRPAEAAQSGDSPFREPDWPHGAPRWPLGPAGGSVDPAAEPSFPILPGRP